MLAERHDDDDDDDKLVVYKSYINYKYARDLASNNLKRLMFHKTTYQSKADVKCTNRLITNV